MKRILLLAAAILGLVPAMALAQGPQQLSVVVTHAHHDHCDHHQQAAIDLRPSADALADEAAELARSLSGLSDRSIVRAEAFELARSARVYSRMVMTQDRQQALAFFEEHIRPKFASLRERIYALARHQSVADAMRAFPELRRAFITASRAVHDAKQEFVQPHRQVPNHQVIVQPVVPRPNYQVYPPYNNTQRSYVYYQRGWY